MESKYETNNFSEQGKFQRNGNATGTLVTLELSTITVKIKR